MPRLDCPSVSAETAPLTVPQLRFLRFGNEPSTKGATREPKEAAALSLGFWRPSRAPGVVRTSVHFAPGVCNANAPFGPHCHCIIVLYITVRFDAWSLATVQVRHSHRIDSYVIVVRREGNRILIDVEIVVNAWPRGPQNRRSHASCRCW